MVDKEKIWYVRWFFCFLDGCVIPLCGWDWPGKLVRQGAGLMRIVAGSSQPSLLPAHECRLRPAAQVRSKPNKWLIPFPSGSGPSRGLQLRLLSRFLPQLRPAAGHWSVSPVTDDQLRLPTWAGPDGGLCVRVPSCFPPSDPTDGFRDACTRQPVMWRASFTAYIIWQVFP
jgi:hypothetical protein